MDQLVPKTKKDKSYNSKDLYFNPAETYTCIIILKNIS